MTGIRRWFLLLLLSVPVLTGRAQINPGPNPGDVGTVSFVYGSQQVTYTTVRAADGNIWLQQNLGSLRVALADNDYAAYGDLFQWGRWDDGHQFRNSATADVSTLSQNNPSGLGTGMPVFYTSSPYWWGCGSGDTSDTWTRRLPTVTNGTDPCAALGSGWRMPAAEEWAAVFTAENITNTASAFSSHLKLPLAGSRNPGIGAPVVDVATFGYYWSSSLYKGPNSGNNYCGNPYIATFFVFNASANGTHSRGTGNSCRCIRVCDSIVHITTSSDQCFVRDSVLLKPAYHSAEYAWQDGTTDSFFIARHTGVYTVTYEGQCTIYTDTFRVAVQDVPFADADSSCPGSEQGKAWVIPVPGDTITCSYNWYDAGNTLLRTHQGIGDTLTGLNPGSYRVHIRSLFHCDTSLYVTVNALPVPEAVFVTDTVVCTGEQVFFDNRSSDTASRWDFGDHAGRSEVYAPSYVYYEAGDYRVTLVTDNGFCTDTFVQVIRVTDLNLQLIASETSVDKYGFVTLTTGATVPYKISMWQPVRLFPDQTAYGQYFRPDSSGTYVVAGISADGCTDTASVSITVVPHIFIPTAFTPNGDGVNDRFHPVVAGGYMHIRFLLVYDRWGKIIWQARGNEAYTGWDGMHQGRPAEMGVYFYLVEFEAPEDGVIRKKGEVTLVR